MALTFITDLSESRLFPTYTNLNKFQAQQVAELIFLYFCGINILSADETTQPWIANYCRRTILYGTFDVKRNVATDLYVLIHAILGDDVHFKDAKTSAYFIDKMSIDLKTMVNYLKAVAFDRPNRTTTRLLFTNIDRRLHVSNSTLRAIRRDAMDWPTLPHTNRKQCMMRLLPYLRTHAYRSEILPFLEKVARHEKLCDPDVDDACNESRSLLKDLHRIGETSSSGGTGSASVATSLGGLGSGFDPNGDWGIYPKPKRKKKLHAPDIIRRAL